MPAAYPEEFRRRAVELIRASDESVSVVAGRLGISVSGLRRWVAQAEIDEGRAPGMSTEDRQELTKLRRENRVLRMGVELVVTALRRRPIGSGS